MILEINNFTVPPDIVLENPIENEELLLTLDIGNVDRVGFDLTLIEQEYYKANNLILNEKEILSKDSKKSSWNTVFDKWFLSQEVAENFFIDHSGLYGVYEFKGRAAEQIKKYIPNRPELAKLLNLKAKVGYDVCVDFIKGEQVIEILHIEHDYPLTQYETFMDTKRQIEHTLSICDWEQVLTHIRKNLQGDRTRKGTDDKAKFLGISPAYKYYNRL